MTTKAKAVEPASKHSKRELISAARSLFGTKPEIMAGALHGVTEDITVEDAKNRLIAFKEKAVD